MNAIANFKKRREANRAAVNELREKVQTNAAEQEPHSEALTLLATLLNCEPENAIAKAKELIEHAESEGLEFVIGLSGAALEEIQLADEEDADSADSGNKSEQTATDLDASAGAVADAADKVNDAAGDLDATANQLAGNADDISTATAELKEATAELKKPLAGRQSSRGKTTGKPKASSKKSG